jgi:endonuclease YncB( thermonuclease family)
MRKRALIGGLALLAMVGAGEAAATAPAATAASTVTRTRARVTSWVDGDTVDTSRGRVRLIGIDTPERGEECFNAATRLAERLAPEGSRVTLIRVLGRDNTDRYDRKLRYVRSVHALDVGLQLIKRGLADARYDSRDGYEWHPRQPAYRRADANHPDRDCTPTPPPPPPPPTGNCHPAYSPCVPPPPPDLNCPDIGHLVFVNHAYGDPHGLDSDGDGRGCESYS